MIYNSSSIFHLWFSYFCKEIYLWFSCFDYECFDGLVQDCSNSIANALELLQSCTKPTISSLLADEVLEDTTLSGRLAADDGDLGKVKVQGDGEGCEGVLEAVHQRDQLLHACVTRHGGHRAVALGSVRKRGFKTFRCVSAMELRQSCDKSSIYNH